MLSTSRALDAMVSEGHTRAIREDDTAVCLENLRLRALRCVYRRRGEGEIVRVGSFQIPISAAVLQPPGCGAACCAPVASEERMLPASNRPIVTGS